MNLNDQRLRVGIALMAVLLGTRTIASAGDPAPPATQPGNAYADLDRMIPELKLESGKTLESAFNAIGQASHSNVVVDWDSLCAAGMKPDVVVRIHLWNVTLQQALRAVIAVVDHDNLLSCEAENEIVRVAQRDTLRRSGQVIRVYDVRSILDAACGPGMPGAPQTQPATAADRASAADNLVTMIQDLIAPKDWSAIGGGADGVASIRAFGDKLIVAQTPDKHREIANLLRRVREGGSSDRLRSSGR